MLQLLSSLDWKAILLGDEKWHFLVETCIRTFVMFTVILLSLRLLGKRGIKQLSVFELGVIIGLGSAAGDPMFYKDVGLLPGIIVFAIVLSLYKLVTFLINKYNSFERFLEGVPTFVIEDGRLLLSNFEKEPLAKDELFSQLRLNSVSHLGQIKQALIETNGEISVFYFADENVKFGLPIIPGQTKYKIVPETGIFSCSNCGNTVELAAGGSATCNTCDCHDWIKAKNEKRIT